MKPRPQKKKDQLDKVSSPAPQVAAVSAEDLYKLPRLPQKELFAVKAAKAVLTHVPVVDWLWEHKSAISEAFEHDQIEFMFENKMLAKELRNLLNASVRVGHTIRLGPDHWRAV